MAGGLAAVAQAARVIGAARSFGGDQRKQSPEVGQDLSDVVTAAAEHGEERIADGAVERAAGQATVGFDVGISASMALRRLRSAISFGVRPRRMPLISTGVLSTPCRKPRRLRRNRLILNT
ncbi:MAG: hypothetical protein JWP57_4190 [Spirosoma sp.]|nr:hypothetical protein [Spirosoma sp.]